MAIINKLWTKWCQYYLLIPLGLVTQHWLLSLFAPPPPLCGGGACSTLPRCSASISSWQSGDMQKPTWLGGSGRPVEPLQTGVNPLFVFWHLSPSCELVSLFTSNAKCWFSGIKKLAYGANAVTTAKKKKKKKWGWGRVSMYSSTFP